MLHYYGERFRTVEISNTFYRMPTVALLQAWASEVPSGFWNWPHSPQFGSSPLSRR